MLLRSTIILSLFWAALAQAATQNILITGFWPPTNGMLRRLSPNPIQNPKGWLGKNFQGSGYDVYAYFPEYPNGGSVGEGDFRVDFASTFNDFMKYTDKHHPVAIVSYGMGGGPWEIEGTDYPYFYKMFNLGEIPSVVNQKVLYPIPESLKQNITYDSSLPLDAIKEAVNSLPGMPVKAWVDQTGGAGDFLCGFMAYLGGWYHGEHSDPKDLYYNAMAGFIHVEASLENAELAMYKTLETVITKLP